MKQIYLALLLAFLATPAAEANRQGELPYQKAGNCDDALIRNEPKMLKALQAIQKKIGRKPILTSCRRSQARQNAIRRSLGCGANNCRGRAAKTSQHTVGVAADIKIQGMQGRALCELLSQVRDSVVGHGGVGAYGDGSGHLDIRRGRAAWNKCGYLGSSNQYRSPKVEKYLKDQNIPSVWQGRGTG